ncbi:MAG: flagellin FliC, partial [Gammaproteobacteria bacterium]
REIAVQASNATVGNAAGLQLEVDQLTQEISRIVQTSEFNGAKLLDGTGGTLTFQVGANGTADNQIDVVASDLTSISAYNASLTNTGTVDVSSTAAAQAALTTLGGDIDTANGERATYGAVQNRFEAVVSNLQNYSENLTAARSRIQDADFAAETASLTRAQILQQAGVSIVAQANALPQAALSLLG